MGGGTKGYKPFRVGRRSHSKKYGVTSVTLLPMDGSKPSTMSRRTLMKRKGNDGEMYISAAIGDMGLMLKGIRVAGVGTPSSEKSEAKQSPRATKYGKIVISHTLEKNRRNFTPAKLTAKNRAPLIPLHLYIEGHKGTLRRLDGPREDYEGLPLDEEYEDYLDVWKAWGGKWTIDDEGIPGLAPGQVVLGRELFGLLQRIPKQVRVKVRGVLE